MFHSALGSAGFDESGHPELLADQLYPEEIAQDPIDAPAKQMYNNVRNCAHLGGETSMSVNDYETEELLEQLFALMDDAQPCKVKLRVVLLFSTSGLPQTKIAELLGVNRRKISRRLEVAGRVWERLVQDQLTEGEKVWLQKNRCQKIANSPAASPLKACPTQLSLGLWDSPANGSASCSTAAPASANRPASSRTRSVSSPIWTVVGR